MDGVIVIRQLLAADAAVTALVPASGARPPRLVAGALPQGVALPAIAITSISATDHLIPAPGATRRVSERVQVTMAAADYPAVRALARAVKHACAARMPTVAGLGEVTVQTDGAGPDFFDEGAAICFRTQDFLVGFNEAS